MEYFASILLPHETADSSLLTDVSLFYERVKPHTATIHDSGDIERWLNTLPSSSESPTVINVEDGTAVKSTPLTKEETDGLMCAYYSFEFLY